MPPVDAPLTQLLQLAAQGERGALDRVFAVLYPELRKIAHSRLRAQGGVPHLAATALPALGALAVGPILFCNVLPRFTPFAMERACFPMHRRSSRSRVKTLERTRSR